MIGETQFSRKYQRRHWNHNSPRPANIQPGQDQRLPGLWVMENWLGFVGDEHFHSFQVERRLGGLLPFSGTLHASFKSFRKHVIHICAEGLSYFPTYSSKTGHMNYTQCHCSSHISNHLIHANFVNIFPYNFSKGKHLFPPRLRKYIASSKLPHAFEIPCLINTIISSRKRPAQISSLATTTKPYHISMHV